MCLYPLDQKKRKEGTELSPELDPPVPDTGAPVLPSSFVGDFVVVVVVAGLGVVLVVVVVLVVLELDVVEVLEVVLDVLEVVLDVVELPVVVVEDVLPVVEVVLPPPVVVVVVVGSLGAFEGELEGDMVGTSLGE